jgi:hypothetical protein
MHDTAATVDTQTNQMSSAEWVACNLMIWYSLMIRYPSLAIQSPVYAKPAILDDFRMFDSCTTSGDLAGTTTAREPTNPTIVGHSRI